MGKQTDKGETYLRYAAMDVASAESRGTDAGGRAVGYMAAIERTATGDLFKARDDVVKAMLNMADRRQDRTQAFHDAVVWLGWVNEVLIERGAIPGIAL